MLNWVTHLFWKIHFINPPEEQSELFRLHIDWHKNDDAKVLKAPIWVNSKIAQCVPYPKSSNFLTLLHKWF